MQILVELRDVAAGLVGIAVDVLPLQVILELEHQRGDVEELALQGGGFTGPGGIGGPRMDPLEREMPPHVAQFVAEVGPHLIDRPGGPAAERALEVAVLDQRQWGVDRAAKVVALGLDRPNQLQPHGRRRA